MIKVLSPGLLTTVQDGGRLGWRRYGVPVCGAMDKYSLMLANILVDNHPEEAALEITALGPRLEFGSKCVFALCGGIFDMRLDGEKISCGKAYGVSPGSVLEIGGAKSGVRGYLAVSGGFLLPRVLGSMSTYIKGGFGGFNGRRLQKEDVIALRQDTGWIPFMGVRELERSLMAYPLSDRPLRVVLGPQLDSFSQSGIDTFLREEYTLTAESDRMGCRLEGDDIEYREGCDGNIISDGIVMGAVQVPSGKPIVMMADCQTTGGYAKIATVISVDLPLMGQKKSGDKVRFQAVDHREALSLIKKQRRMLENIEFYHDFW